MTLGPDTYAANFISFLRHLPFLAYRELFRISLKVQEFLMALVMLKSQGQG